MHRIFRLNIHKRFNCRCFVEFKSWKGKKNQLNGKSFQNEEKICLFPYHLQHKKHLLDISDAMKTESFNNNKNLEENLKWLTMLNSLSKQNLLKVLL